MTADQWVLGSLFSGIGGTSLAAQWMGWRTAFFSEIEPYQSRVLAKNFPGVPNLGDITKIRGADLPPIDILTGGFPCQDISLAGKRAGITGERSGLWREYARLIDEMPVKPRYILPENVSALRSPIQIKGTDEFDAAPLHRVLSDLHSLGYDAEWHCIPASAVGAPHQRDRIFILAYLRETVDDRICTGLEGHSWYGEICGWGPRPTGSAPEADLLRGRESRATGGAWWANEPGVGRVVYGLPAYVDRITALGNTVVPTIPYQIFRAIRAQDARPSVSWEHSQLIG